MFYLFTSSPAGLSIFRKCTVDIYYLFVVVVVYVQYCTLIKEGELLEFQENDEIRSHR